MKLVINRALGHMQAPRGSLCDKISYGPVTGIHIYNYYSVQLYPWDSNINPCLLGSTDLDMHFRFLELYIINRSWPCKLQLTTLISVIMKILKFMSLTFDELKLISLTFDKFLLMDFNRKKVVDIIVIVLYILLLQITLISLNKKLILITGCIH